MMWILSNYLSRIKNKLFKYSLFSNRYMYSIILNIKKFLLEVFNGEKGEAHGLVPIFINQKYVISDGSYESTLFRSGID